MLAYVVSKQVANDELRFSVLIESGTYFKNVLSFYRQDGVSTWILLDMPPIHINSFCKLLLLFLIGMQGLLTVKKTNPYYSLPVYVYHLFVEQILNI